MTSEEKSSSSEKGPFILPPWLVILGALLLYGLTLNHWVTLSSLPVISKVTGWDWHPLPLSWRQTQIAPLFFVLTCPVRLLPVAWQPVALNAFSAICAALTLGLLAASVRLLPHDRTREQRQREGGEFALLSLPTAFLPALFAVLILSMQLTFWRNAIAATGNMLDVLVFAFLIYCLLRFRISQNDNWLAVFSFVYGLGTTNNWALVGFFPFFFVALVWIRGVSFFNLRFLARMAGWGFLGLLLYLLVPAMGSLGADRANFFSLLHMELGAQSFNLRLVPRWIAVVAALPTLLPLFFAGIRWPSFEGELSAAGGALTKLMFCLLHVVFLLLALVMFFDFKYSPSLRLQDAPNSVGFLTFYYMGALCIGYFSGYILLVFGKSAGVAREKRGLVSRIYNLVILIAFWLLAVAAPCGLLYQNLPHINAGKSNALAVFSREVIQDLPVKPAKPVILLADDSMDINLLQAALCREGMTNQNIMIETASLPHKEYITYLVSRYPKLKKVTRSPEQLASVLPADSLARYMYEIAKDFSIYYLHPSFGYYFEIFYMKPHGLIYELQFYPTNTASVQAPLPTSQEVKINQDNWARIGKNALTDLPALAKLDPEAASISVKYSVGLDFWGVNLQKAGYLKEANAKFAEAERINPLNFVAKINREYNERLQKNDHQPVNSTDINKAVSVYRGIVPVLRFNGPCDEPNLNLEFGSLMAQGHDWRQATALFERRLQLLPGDAGAELDLAKTFVDSGRPGLALDLIRKLKANPTANKWEVTRVEALAYYGNKDFPTAERLLQNAIKEDPHDENRVAILAEFYRVTGYAALREMDASKDEPTKAKHGNEATQRFNNALNYYNQLLQILPLSSQNTTGPHSIADTLLKKAEVEMKLKSFKPGITTLNKVLDLQPDNQTALLNRAVAEAQLHQFQSAKDDYTELRKVMPQQTYVADFGLAEIAALETNRTDEIRYLKHYLKSAPQNTREYQQVNAELRKLQAP